MMISIRRALAASAASAVTLAMGAGMAAPAAATPRAMPLSARAVPVVHVAAATTNAYTVLHSFVGADGQSPTGDLDLAIKNNGNDNYTRTLWGETLGGGNASSGTIFTDVIGTANSFATKYQFTGLNDGALPNRGLANNESNYFGDGSVQLGVTNQGGTTGYGTVFVVSGMGAVTNVYTFTGGNDGAFPSGRITQFTDGNYYGTTTAGGAYGFGTIYRLSSKGAFTSLYSFTGNADGASPAAGLSLRVNVNGKANAMPRTPEMGRGFNVADTVGRARAMNSQYVSPYLYGTTSSGGATNSGTIFRITPAGKLTTLYAFTGLKDGASPQAKLSTDLNGNLYGTTSVGGSMGNGTVFKLAQGNAKPMLLEDFGNGAVGAQPLGQIVVAFDGNLYGTTSQGGAAGLGTVFKITSKGVVSDIHDFMGLDGSTPEGGLVDGGDGTLFGATSAGGADASGSGVLFSIAE